MYSKHCFEKINYLYSSFWENLISPLCSRPLSYWCLWKPRMCQLQASIIDAWDPAQAYIWHSIIHLFLNFEPEFIQLLTHQLVCWNHVDSLVLIQMDMFFVLLYIFSYFCFPTYNQTCPSTKRLARYNCVIKYNIWLTLEGALWNQYADDIPKSIV